MNTRMAQHESLVCTLYPRPEQRGFTVGWIKILHGSEVQRFGALKVSTI